MAQIDGTAGNDALVGTAVDDTISGLAGSDILFALGGNDTLDGGAGVDVLNGSSGNDTYFVDDPADVITDSSGIDAVFSTVSFLLPSGVEHLTLEGADPVNGTGNASNNILTGNASDNSLQGMGGVDTLDAGDGNDILSGGTGADTMIGGLGDDIYVVDNKLDVVVEGNALGTDTVEASASFTLTDDIENLTLTGKSGIGGVGNGLDNVITGNIGGNSLSGGDGNDTIDGSAGADTMAGNNGDDIFFVDNVSDKIVELAGEGNDTVFAKVNYTLSSEVENLTLTGVVAIMAAGNAGDNLLTGNDGNNTLDGRGGDDTLVGGLGNDVYIVDSLADVVTENAAEGSDTIMTALSLTLGAEVENLTLTGFAAVTGTGNGLGNILRGNLNLAANQLVGGDGDDTYFIGAGDTVVELFGEGTDTVVSSLTYTLGAEVENLTLAGSSSIHGTGNSLDNAITGNGGGNSLDGGDGADTLAGAAGSDILNGADGDDTLLGGTGSDTMGGGEGNDTLDGGTGTNIMRGGNGDDVYVIATASGQIILENAGEGTADEVVSSVTYTLGAELEKLTLAGAALNGTGNGLDNIITGNAGANTLNGLAGDDTMIGGGGNDVYIVDSALDLTTEIAGGGTDKVLSGIDWVLAAEVENLTLTGIAAVNGEGNAGDNVLTGNIAANILTGGDGNDTYIIDALDTVAVDTDGTDGVVVGFSYDLTARLDLENITLTGSAALNATGNTNDNILLGNSGSNILNGGDGNDTYGITSGDTIVDSGGIDTVRAGFSYTLIAGMENLTLTGTGSYCGTGNAADNTITGNAGNNTLDGMDGTDLLRGGLGNDVYTVDIFDTVEENADEGTDTIKAGFTYLLGDDVENLILTGTADIDGTGNGLSNIITGNGGRNTLDGGAGADFLTGGAGDDTFIVDDEGDVLKDSSGSDTVSSSVTWLLASGFEHLTLTGADDIDGTGNSAANIMSGNAGNNSLYGLTGNDILIGGDGEDGLDGGAGNDLMIGGDDDDVYLIDAAGDTVIENFDEGIDVIGVFVTYTLPANVEHMVLWGTGGTGTNTLHGTGNELDNIIVGSAGTNVIDGVGGDDKLAGGAGNDTLRGGFGDDTLVGEDGTDTLFGGADADLFVFEEASAFLAIDTIRDFNTAEGDAIDLTDLLSAYDPLTDVLTDFVKITTSGSSSYLYINAAGTGSGADFVRIANLSSATGLTDEEALVLNGNLIVS
jgi:trimeric autotransporter adhesin